MTALTTAQASAAERLLNRELSWLEFNARVLELAADDGLPLLERVKFCAIFSRNLDEFFMVRVAGLWDQAELGVAARSPDGLLPAEALTAIRTRVDELVAQQSHIWRRRLVPALAEAGITVCSLEECEPGDIDELGERFDRDIFPVLTPLGVGPGQPFPFISPLSLSLGVLLRDPESEERRFARVKVPESLPRFVQVGDRKVLVPMENVIAHFLDRLFPGMEAEERAAFRVTRDADFEVSDEADDLLEAIQIELRRRRFGEVVRLEVSASMSDAMLDRLRRSLRASESQVYRVRGLLDMADLSEIAALERPELKDEPWTPVTRPRLRGVGDDGDLFAEIARGDLLVHQPYESFATSFEAFIQGAARDRSVEAIKTTVYRTSGASPIVPALTAAAERGKQSVCLVELKARFDEGRNIEWARSLEKAGVHVVYGFPDVKIHAKTTLVVRREGDALRRYVHIGTGNYHALTARLYEDVGLFTADEEIAADVADLFNLLTGFARPAKFRKLLVAPWWLRKGLVAEIRRVAAAGSEGRIRIKVNSLADPGIVQELYAAAQAGASIDIVARSICTLRPGIEGVSDTVRVRSILGRFLEHSRLYGFSTPERESWYLGSADLMARNLDHRIEILAPVEDTRARGELDTVFEALLRDNSSAWELHPDGTWSRAGAKKGARRHGAQTTLMRRARTSARRGTPSRARRR